MMERYARGSAKAKNLLKLLGLDVSLDNISLPLQISLSARLSAAVDLEEIDGLLICATHIITGGEPFDSFFSRFKEDSAACGKVWGPGCILYRCRTCQYFPTNCICSSCFKNGPHEHHDYVIERSTYGGSCDCGNLDVWPLEGTCSDHRPKQANKPVLETEEAVELDKRINSIIEAVICYVTERPRAPSHIKAVIEWMGEFSSTFQKFRRFLCAKMISQYSAENPQMLEEYIQFSGDPPIDFERTGLNRQFNAIDVFLAYGTHCPQEVDAEYGKLVAKFFMHFLVNTDFRTLFVDIYIDMYDVILRSVIKRRNGLFIMKALGCHIFTTFEFQKRINKGTALESFILSIRSLLHVMRHKCNCEVDTECECPADSGDCSVEFERTLKLARHIKSPRYHSFSNKNTRTVRLEERFIYDMKILDAIEDINNILNSKYFPDLPGSVVLRIFTQYLDILFPFQLMHRMRVQWDDHVEFTSNLWKMSWPIASVLTSSFNVERIPKSGGAFDATLQLSCSILAEWVELKLGDCEESLVVVGEVPTLAWDVLRDPATFHVPLHRIFLRLLRHATETRGEPLEVVLGSLNLGKMSEAHTKLFVPAIVEYPMRSLLLYFSVASGFWLKNGDEPLFSSQLYLKNFAGGDEMDLDLFAVKLGVQLLGFDHMIELLLEKAGLAEIMIYPPARQRSFEEACSTIDARKVSHMLENLTFLFVYMGGAIVPNDQYGVSSPEEVDLMEFLVHKIATGEWSYSEIMEGMPSYFSKHSDMVESLMEGITAFKISRSSSSRVYVLNERGWSLFNPFYVKYTRKERGDALNTWSSWMKSNGAVEDVKKVNETFSFPFKKMQKSQMRPSEVETGLSGFHNSYRLFVYIHWILSHLSGTERSGEDAHVRSLLESTLSLLDLVLNGTLPCDCEDVENVGQPVEKLTSVVHQREQDGAKRRKRTHKMSIHEFCRVKFSTKRDSYEYQQIGGDESSSTLVDVLLQLASEKDHILDTHSHKLLGKVLKKLKHIDQEFRQTEDPKADNLLGLDANKAVEGTSKREEMAEVAKKRRAELLRRIAVQSERAAIAHGGLSIGNVENDEKKQILCVICKEQVDNIYSDPAGLISHVFVSSTSQKAEEYQNNCYYGPEFRREIVETHLMRSISKMSIRSSSSSNLSLSKYIDGDALVEDTDTKVDLLLRILKSTDDREIKKEKRGNDEFGSLGMANITHCGHYMHFRCFAGFYRSMIISTIEGSPEQVDITKSEFFCPACRRLSNILIPVVNGVPFSLYERRAQDSAFHLNSERLFSSTVEKEKENLARLRNAVEEKDVAENLSIMVNFAADDVDDIQCAPPPRTFKRNVMKYKMLLKKLQGIVPPGYVPKFCHFDADVFQFNLQLLRALAHTLSKISCVRGHNIVNVLDGGNVMFYCEILHEIIQQMEVGSRYTEEDDEFEDSGSLLPAANSLDRNILAELVNNVAICVIASDSSTEARNELFIDIFESIFTLEVSRNTQTRRKRKQKKDVNQIKYDRRFSTPNPAVQREHSDFAGEVAQNISCDAIPHLFLRKGVDEYLEKVKESTLEKDTMAILLQLIVVQMPISEENFRLSVHLLLPHVVTQSIVYLVDSALTFSKRQKFMEEYGMSEQKKRFARRSNRQYAYSYEHDASFDDGNDQDVDMEGEGGSGAGTAQCSAQDGSKDAEPSTTYRWAPDHLLFKSFSHPRAIHDFITGGGFSSDAYEFIEHYGTLYSLFSYVQQILTSAEVNIENIIPFLEFRPFVTTDAPPPLDNDKVAGWNDILRTIHAMTLVFLRRAFILFQAVFDTSSAQSKASKVPNRMKSFIPNTQDVFREFDYYKGIFGIESDFDKSLFDFHGVEKVFLLSGEWTCRHVLHRQNIMRKIEAYRDLYNPEGPNAVESKKNTLARLLDTNSKRINIKLVNSLSLPACSLPIPALLINLPKNFLSCYEEVINKICMRCGRIPNYAGICLVCGELICIGSECCRKNNVGEAFRHTMKCGAGIGMLLIIKTSRILIIRGGRSSFYRSPYLDSHEEEDIHFSRSKPLFLSEKRYAEMNYLYMANKFDWDTRIFNECSSDTTLL